MLSFYRTPVRRPASRLRAAFTLVELLVAVTVTLLLVVVLAQVFQGASNSWLHSEAQVDAYREARGALQLMARDLGATLQSSYAQAAGGTGTLITSPAVPTLALEHSPDVMPPPNGPVNEEIYFLTNIPNAGTGTLCTVGYFCEWMPSFLPAPANGSADTRPQAYALMRLSLDSNGTFKRFQAASMANKNPLTFSDLFTQAGPPAATVTQVAAYIWDLRFRIDTDLNDGPQYTPDGNSTPPPDHSQPVRHYGADASYQPYPPQLPLYVEIRFRALSDLAARRLEGAVGQVTPATWADTTSGFVPSSIYQQVIAKNYQQFVLRLPLMNASPLPTPTPGP